MSLDRRTRPEDARWQLFSGWGRTSPTPSVLEAPTSNAQVSELISTRSRVLVRGLGRSYGDAAQSAGGTLVDLSAFTSIDWSEDGAVTVAAGLSLHELINRALPNGWFVPVSPGTSWVTVGGAIAADVHGKNHHRDGSFGSHLERIGVIDGHGQYLDLHRDDPRFWATIGGMGLTGIIVDATVRLTPVGSPSMVVSTRRTKHFDDTVAQLQAADAARYSVAWLDCLATGAETGRGVVTFGDHASGSGMGSVAGRSRHSSLKRPRVTTPTWIPSGVLSRRSVSMFNAAWHRRAPLHRDGESQTIAEFFHPLDAVGNWNRAYGPRGFVQYQFVVPLDAVDVLRSVFVKLVGAQVPSFLTVLKRFGPGNIAPLSFPMPGWTLAVDIPADVPDLGRLLDALDEDIVGVGGRIYLAKDSRMAPALLPQMYPQLEQWRQVRDSMDPRGIFISDLGRRLHLVDQARS